MNSYSFYVKVMTKPAFNDGTTSFADKIMPLNGKSNFPISTYSDADGDTVTLTIEEGSGGTLPGWIKLVYMPGLTVDA